MKKPSPSAAFCKCARALLCTITFGCFTSGAFAQVVQSTATASSASPTTAPAKPSAVAKSGSDDNDETVHLDVFEVKSRASNNDYMQTETTTGTRIATKINDLPFTVESLTSEFMQDFDLLDMSGEDLASAISGVSDITTEDKFTMRGAETNYTLRDGFFRLGLNDRSNVDSVQVIKGPSASMYGQTMPTGIINVLSKRPKNKNSDKVGFFIASEDTYRFELEDNKRLLPSGKLNNIFTASISQNGSWVNDYGFQKKISLYDAIAWKISPTTLLTFQIEWSRIRATDTTAFSVSVSNALFGQSPTNTLSNGAYDPRLGTVKEVLKEVSDFSLRGPSAAKNREIVTPTLVLEHRFNRIWSARMAGYYYYRRSPQIGTNTTGVATGAPYGQNSYGEYIVRGLATASAGAYIPGTTPVAGNNGSEYAVAKFAQFGGAVQGDITAAYRLFGGKARGTSVLTADYNTNRRQRRHQQMTNERFFQLVPYGYTGGVVYIDNPDYKYYAPSISDYTSINRNDDTNWQDLGISFRQQLFMLKDKLRLFASVRYDMLWFNNTYHDQYTQAGNLAVYSASTKGSTGDPDSPLLDPTSALFDPRYTYNPDHHGADIGPGRTKSTYSDVFKDHALLPSFGVNYQLTSWMAPYFSYSQSFTPNSQNTSMGNSEIPDETGKGIDYGLKFNLFNEKLWLTTTGYWISRDHVKAVGNQSDSSVDVSAGGTYRSQGFETTLNWRVVQGLQAIGSYSYCDTKILSNPGTQAIVGLRAPNIPLHQASFALKYQFPAPLKGLSLTPKIYYFGQSFPDTTYSGAGTSYTLNGRTVSSGDLIRHWEVPGYVVFQIGLNYTFKLSFWRGATHSIGVSVKNLFDREYINQKGAYVGSGRVTTFSYKLSF